MGKIIIDDNNIEDIIKNIDYKEEVLKFNTSEVYQKIKRYYSQKSFFSIIEKSRDEDVHSNFLSWFFNPDVNMGFESFPIKKLIQLLCYKSYDSDNSENFPKEIKNHVMVGAFEVNDVKEINRENILKNMSKKRIDILILCSIRVADENKILPIIIENKVMSKETNSQTGYYYQWAIEEYSDRKKYLKPVFSFLSIQGDNADVDDAHFLKISYQNLVDYIIEPSLSIEASITAIVRVKDYLRCLSVENSITELVAGGNTIMAISKEEKDLLKLFIKENRNLILGALYACEDEYDDEDSKMIEDARNILSRKNMRLLLNGKTNSYGKPYFVRRIVWRLLRITFKIIPG